MNLTSVLNMLKSLAPVLEPILLQAEQGQLVPAINAEIAKISSPDVKLLLQSLATGIEAFIEAETQKL